ncbi:MAG: glycosyltransferase [Actinomycetota bacterium]
MPTGTRGPKVAVVVPGRPSLGEQARTATWRRLTSAIGGRCTIVPVMQEGVRPSLLRAPGVATGSLVPEALAWRPSAVSIALEVFEPDVVVLQTARTVRPELLRGPWPVIIDLVDRLSLSYRQRARFVGGPRAALLNGLARSHRLFEDRIMEDDAVSHPVVMAGRRDAEDTGAVWLPLVMDPPVLCTPPPVDPPHDVVFFGSLSYPPNVEALERLAEGRPTEAGLRVLVAGRRPPARVENLCREHGWSLEADFASLRWLAEQAAVAVAPLRSTAGIQNKLIDAALAGMPQVVTSESLAGLAPGFPCMVADEPTELVAEARRLLVDDERRCELATAAFDHVAANYSVSRWLPLFERLIAAAGTVRSDGRETAKAS